MPFVHGHVPAQIWGTEDFKIRTVASSSLNITNPIRHQKLFPLPWSLLGTPFGGLIAWACKAERSFLNDKRCLNVELPSLGRVHDSVAKAAVTKLGSIAVKITF